VGRPACRRRLSPASPRRAHRQHRACAGPPRALDHAGESRVLRLLGIDPFAEAPFREFVAPAAGVDFGALLARRTVLLEAGDCALHCARRPAIRCTCIAGRGARQPCWAACSSPVTHWPARAARRRAGRHGDGAGAGRRDGSAGPHRAARGGGRSGRAPPRRDVRALLPPGARLLETGADRRDGALTRAFETNLTALALVALVFGMFLIYNSVTFSLVQRRPLIGLLRAQGVTAAKCSGWCCWRLRCSARGHRRRHRRGRAAGHRLVSLVAAPSTTSTSPSP
jgi:putative ABC transport system permease protein